MKKLFSYLIFIFIFIVSCNSDDSNKNSQTGNLQVTVLSENGEPIVGAIISTTPATVEKTTGVSGVVSFNNIDPIAYSVHARLPSDFFRYTSLTNIVAGETSLVEIMIEGIEPITSSLNIEHLLEQCYELLKGKNIFNAMGYSTYWGDIGGDILFKNDSGDSAFSELDQYRTTTTNRIVLDVWTDHYRAIHQVNLGLKSLANNEYTSEHPIVKNEYEAEFKFLRALLYFNLVKLYGNPVVVTTTNYNLDNPLPIAQGIEATYDLIVSDLKSAQTALNTSNTNTRASLSASQALLGKIYLQMAGYPLQQTEKYALALAELDKLVGNFSLEPNYADIFSLENEASSTEVIFKIPFDQDGNYGFFWGALGIAPEDQFEMVGSFAENFFEKPENIISPVTFPLEIKDSRFNHNIATFKYENQQIINLVNIDDWRPYKFKKTLGAEINYNSESFDFPYLRYADVLLMIAEAENAINGPSQKAYTAVNQVRRRAFGNSDNDINPDLNQEDFLKALLAERRRELCFEGQRKDDLIRTETLTNVITNFNEKHPQYFKSYESYKYIWPIPQRELDLNEEAQQNTGY